jgi:alpha-N-arabinofuranosidase
MEPKLKMPEGVENKMGEDEYFPNANFTYTEDFSSEKLDYRWIGLRVPREDFIDLTKKGLKINPFDVNIKEVKPTSTLFHRQQHKDFSFTATIDYKPKSEKDLAGITALQNERFNYVFGITKYDKKYYLVLERTEKGSSKILDSKEIELKDELQLKVEAEGDDYKFSYALKEGDFQNLGGTVSGDILSTNVAGGFTGNMIGLYATSANDAVPEK